MYPSSARDLRTHVPSHPARSEFPAHFTLSIVPWGRVMSLYREDHARRSARSSRSIDPHYPRATFMHFVIGSTTVDVGHRHVVAIKPSCWGSYALPSPTLLAPHHVPASLGTCRLTGESDGGQSHRLWSTRTDNDCSISDRLCHWHELCSVDYHLLRYHSWASTIHWVGCVQPGLPASSCDTK